MSDARQLTADDSIAGEIVAAGLANAEVAMASPHAHVLTRWLGADDGARPPHVQRFCLSDLATQTRAGVLMLCSDGLWNYMPEAAGLAALAMPEALTDPIGAAGELVRFALDAGGADNITVALIPVPLDAGPTMLARPTVVEAPSDLEAPTVDDTPVIDPADDGQGEEDLSA